MNMIEQCGGVLITGIDDIDENENGRRLLYHGPRLITE
jgi:hypothetical protein